jgi:hypothetical protein
VNRAECADAFTAMRPHRALKHEKRSEVERRNASFANASARAEPPGRDGAG